jgi:hypothetical protein
MRGMPAQVHMPQHTQASMTVVVVVVVMMMFPVVVVMVCALARACVYIPGPWWHRPHLVRFVTVPRLQATVRKHGRKRRR